MKAASSALPCLTGRVSTRASPAGPLSPPKPPRMNADEAAVHALAHDVAEDRARRPDQGPGDDQGDVLQREAQCRRGPAGIGVQHRHHDRHVGAADRDDQRRAHDQGDGEDAPERPDRMAARPDHDADQQHQPQRQGDVDQVARRQDDRCATHVAVQLGEGDDRAGEGDGPNGDTQRQLDDRLQLDPTHPVGDAERVGRIDRADRDQTGRHPDQRMERGHQLGHVGHLDLGGDQRSARRRR